MELRLVRRWLTPQATIGQLDLNGVFECYTLEDPVREEKIPGQSAIPAGRYEVIVTYSVRFAAMLPLLKNVPGFTGIRIHAGNTASDTEGCILVGQTREKDFIGQSRKALDRLMMKLAHRFTVWITVSNPEGDYDVFPADSVVTSDGPRSRSASEFESSVARY